MRQVASGWMKHRIKTTHRAKKAIVDFVCNGITERVWVEINITCKSSMSHVGVSSNMADQQNDSLGLSSY